MNLNPLTLLEDNDEDRLERQRTTGVMGNGLSVFCVPDPAEPYAQHQTSRAVCLARPYVGCPYCPHSVFTLVFNENRAERYDRVACPRWRDEASRLGGAVPDSYAFTEIATCELMPYDSCPSCPSRADLHSQYATDKRKEGWYERWSRLRKVELDHE